MKEERKRVRERGIVSEGGERERGGERREILPGGDLLRLEGNFYVLSALRRKKEEGKYLVNLAAGRFPNRHGISFTSKHFFFFSFISRSGFTCFLRFRYTVFLFGLPTGLMWREIH